MYRLLMIGMDALSTAVVAVPILAIVMKTMYQENTKGRMAVLFLFAFYIAAVFGAVGMPTIQSLVIDFGWNALPFIDILNSPLDYLKNSLLNIILFIPLGCFAPLLWNRYSQFKNIVRLGFFVSLLIEISQIFTFRLTDIDDLIMNTLGTAAGWFLMKKFLPKGTGHCRMHRKEERLKRLELPVIVGVVFIVRFLVKSVIYDLLLWY